MQLLHSLARTRAVFDDPNLLPSAGLAPLLALAERAGLPGLLAGARPAGPCGAGTAAKAMCLVAGMAAGADTIDGMDVLHDGATGTVSGGIRAPSTPGSFLRAFTRGNHRNRQLVKLRVLKSAFLPVSVAGVAVWAIVTHGDNRQRAGCGDGGGPAGATASRLSGQILGCAFRRAGPACAERPYVVTNRVRPGAAWGRPGSRHRATGFMQGAAGLPMVSRELWRSTSMRARLRPPGKARVRAGGSEDRACPGCCQLTQRLPSYGRLPGRRRWPAPRPGRW